MGFSGFNNDTLYTPVPNPLFGPVLEQIQDLAELKVTLRGLWLLHRKKGWPKTITLREFLADKSLLRGLENSGKNPSEEINRGLELAVTRGTFLLYRPETDNGEDPVYLLNTESSRTAVTQMRRGVLSEQAPPR